MQNHTLNSYYAEIDNYVDRAFFDLMKSTSEIHDSHHEFTSDCLNQIKVVVNVLNKVISRHQTV